jgi:hypothetical protein
VAGEPPVGALEVVTIHQGELGQQPDRPLLTDGGTEGVQTERAQVRPERAGEDDQRHAHLILTAQEAGQRQYHLAGQRREHGLDQDQ